jgi:hypothetical protein
MYCLIKVWNYGVVSSARLVTFRTYKWSIVTLKYRKDSVHELYWFVSETGLHRVEFRKGYGIFFSGPQRCII